LTSSLAARRLTPTAIITIVAVAIFVIAFVITAILLVLGMFG
jgi:hypothetical protein